MRSLKLAITLAVVTSLTLTTPAVATKQNAPATDMPPVRYVALGDSYTAAPLVPTTSIAGGCFRSDHNYPAVFAAAHPAYSLADVSCSGATTTDFLQPQNTPFGPVPAQLDAVTPETGLVSLSIGGNDESVFGTLVTFCPTLRASDPTGAPCRRAMKLPGHRDALKAAVHRTRTRVLRMVRAVKTRAPHARIVVVGYPQIVPTTGTCTDILPLADRDYRYARVINHLLTKALRRAARKTGSTYINIWRASRGHDICSADPWINGSKTDKARAQAYHPFAVEQAAVADLMAAALDTP